ncbi:hypothetical protein Tco_1080940 [Tanacetum coccineum]|uniref:F-box domain-containing protein n=1 Tax=Tanacetum coccineum TaxID=301880 RepID=A0ABQ5HW63_9ASTR
MEGVDRLNELKDEMLLLLFNEHTPERLVGHITMEGVDRLNELKDEMLVNNIMSRLDCTTKEVIQTTATISKRWKNLWTSLPHLFFSNGPAVVFGYDDRESISEAVVAIEAN